MKTLQLNKYLLIEPKNPVYLTVSESGLFYADPESEKSELIEGKFKFICMGDDFEQDQKVTKKDACVLGQIFCKLGYDAFVQEVILAGYYWGNHSVKNPIKSNYGFHDSINILDSPSEWDDDAYYDDLANWKEAESKTFNPSKTRIYEKI